MSRWWFSLLVCLLIFLIPSNLFLAFPTGVEYVGGLRVDYLIPKLYVSDLVVLAILGSFLIWKRKQYQQIMPAMHRIQDKRSLGIGLGLLIGLFILRQFLTAVPLISIISLIRIAADILLMLVLLQLSPLIKRSYLMYTLVITIIFQSVVAFYQWTTQTPVFGYWFFGEPDLHFPLGLAKASWWGRELISPYGTTAHPNVLGGILAVYLVIFIVMLLSQTSNRWRKTVIGLTLFIGTAVLLLSQSLSALLTLLAGVSIIIVQQVRVRKQHPLLRMKAWQFWTIFVVGSLLCFSLLQFSAQVFTDSSSITRRNRLNSAAIELIQQRPIVGTGLSLFTYSLDQSVSRAKVIVPFLQPAHNIFLLSLAEVGLLGVAALYSIRRLLLITRLNDDLLGWFGSRLPMLCLLLLPIAFLDHYLITLNAGLLLLTIFPLLLMKVSGQSQA